MRTLLVLVHILRMVISLHPESATRAFTAGSVEN